MKNQQTTTTAAPAINYRDEAHRLADALGDAQLTLYRVMRHIRLLSKVTTATDDDGTGDETLSAVSEQLADLASTVETIANFLPNAADELSKRILH